MPLPEITPDYEDDSDGDGILDGLEMTMESLTEALRDFDPFGSDLDRAPGAQSPAVIRPQNLYIDATGANIDGMPLLGPSSLQSVEGITGTSESPPAIDWDRYIDGSFVEVITDPSRLLPGPMGPDMGNAITHDAPQLIGHDGFIDGEFHEVITDTNRLLEHNGQATLDEEHSQTLILGEMNDSMRHLLDLFQNDAFRSATERAHQQQGPTIDEDAFGGPQIMTPLGGDREGLGFADNLFQGLFAGLTAGATATGKGLLGALGSSGLLSAVGGLLAKVGPLAILTTVGVALKDAIDTGIASERDSLVGMVSESVVGGLAGAIDFLTIGLVKEDTITEYAAPLVDAVESFWSGIGEMFAASGDLMMGDLGSANERMVNAFYDFTNVVGVLGEYFDDFVGLIKSVMPESMLNAVEEAGDSVVGFFGKAKQFAQDKFDERTEQLSDAYQYTRNTVVETASGVGNMIEQGAFGPMVVGSTSPFMPMGAFGPQTAIAPIQNMTSLSNDAAAIGKNVDVREGIRQSIDDHTMNQAVREGVSQAVGISNATRNDNSQTSITVNNNRSGGMGPMNTVHSNGRRFIPGM